MTFPSFFTTVLLIDYLLTHADTLEKGVFESQGQWRQISEKLRAVTEMAELKIQGDDEHARSPHHSVLEHIDQNSSPSFANMILGILQYLQPVEEQANK